MSVKMTYNTKCPYCDKECNNIKDEFTVTRGKTKQYFHRVCYYANTIKNR